MTRPTTYTYRPGITQDMVDAIAWVQAQTSGIETYAALSAGETVKVTPLTSARTLVLTSSGPAFVCSIAAGAVGDRKTIVNGGVYPITLGHREGAAYGGAADIDCLDCPDLIPYVLRPGEDVEVNYGPENALVLNRWNVEGDNTFAPGGFLCPKTIAEFLGRTAFTLTYLWPCDDGGLGSAQPLREAGNANLAAVGAPLIDQRMGGFRGHRVNGNTAGWASDILAPGTNSILRGLFLGAGSIAGATQYIFGRYGADVGNIAGIKSTGNFFGFVTDSNLGYDVEVVGKDMQDSVVRLCHLQIDKAATVNRARVSGRGEAAVAATPVSNVGMGTLTGGASPKDFIGGAGIGGTANVVVCGAYMIIGAAAAGALNQAKIAHRLGME